MNDALANDIISVVTLEDIEETAEIVDTPVTETTDELETLIGISEKLDTLNGEIVYIEGFLLFIVVVILLHYIYKFFNMFFKF